LLVDEFSQNSKKNTRILLTRNTPVALVVGAASFFGSHLIDQLLLKDLQVIGVDDLALGKKENLAKATESKNFHLVIESAENLNLELERLDYVFLIPQASQNIQKVLDLFKKLKSRLLLVSSIDLYDEGEIKESLKRLKKIESDTARIAKENNLNARILRLGPIFGPRMIFDNNLEKIDPMIKLIQLSLIGDLQKDTSSDFSSRSLYIDDACKLATKCIFAGATAQKIFDGVLPSPIKVSEIKQVLLDPIWYENKNFSPSELPPWPTPNLDKTIKFLNWHPNTKLVDNLKKTLNYFKEHEIKIPRPEIVTKTEQIKVEIPKEPDQLKTEKIREFKNQLDKAVGEKKPGKKGSKIKVLLPIILFMLVGYALIWPVLQLGWGVLTFKQQLTAAADYLEKGDFEKSLSSVNQAKLGVVQAKAILSSLESVRQLGLLKSQFEVGDNLTSLATLSADSVQNTILGIQNLISSLKSITGELNDSPKNYFDQSTAYLSLADEDLSKSAALINSSDFKSSLPKILRSKVDILAERLAIYTNLVKKGRALSLLLPEVVALDGKKTYLVILQNNNELRPTGGFIGSFAKISFEGGRLKNLEVNDTYAIDGQLKIHVEPPKEIKEDLNQKDYFLRDANFEPDFPTSARQIEWFYTKETGERVAGVIALDISAVEDLLSVVGPLDLADYKEQINSANLFEKAISHAEINFFPGTQAKKSFLAALTQGLFNKLFFLPNQNWPGIVTSLGRSLEKKHLSIYLDNQTLFSYIIAQNWGGVLPRPVVANEGVMADLLIPVEANLGANKANYYLDRKYNLETVIGKDGEVGHRLRVAYINRSPSDAFPGGKYKNRMRVYLPSGTKLNRALWGEKDISKEVTSFTDYGRSGFSFLTELLPKEQKTLILDYQLPTKLSFKNNQAVYRLDIVKQAGTLKDPFVWSVTYPINIKLSSSKTQKIGPQEQTIKTDLSENRTFELEFTRP